jgi:hypothetical protein
VDTRTANTNLIRLSFKQIETWNHKFLTRPAVHEADLVTSGALPRIQDFLSPEHRPVLTAKRMPIHIIEDLSIIFDKWERGNFSILPGRGLRRSAPNRRAYPIPGYELRRAADVFGHNGLVNGQVWATRCEMYRDGAH